MKILLANHWLKKLGGSETFTYTMAGELKAQGHNVDLFTNVPGLVSTKIKKDFGITECLQTSYDLILANHYTTVNKLHQLGPTVQTIHGISPKLEQPSRFAKYYVSISAEIQAHLTQKSTLILNGIDCNRFKPIKPLNKKPKKVLSLVFSDQANQIIEQACNLMQLELITLNKHKNPVWSVEAYINQADIIIGLGRCTFEAMACGRPVIVFDNRPYMPSYADGYLNKTTLKESIKNNCSGRRFKLLFNHTAIINELLCYTPEDGDYLRSFALKELNIQNQVKKYLNLLNT